MVENVPTSEPDSEHQSMFAKRLAFLIPIIGAPLGLAVAIILSLMIAGWHVTHSVVVQAENSWRPGEQLSLRASLLNAEQAAVPGVEVLAEVRRGQQSQELGRYQAGPDGHALANFEVPNWEPGPSKLHLHFSADGKQLASEQVDIAIEPEREARTGALTVSASTLNWGDNTEDQPEDIRINVRPIGRLLAGFDNILMVRVAKPDGTPHQGPIRVRLLEGEFMGKRGAEPAPLLLEKSTSSLGLVELKGPYASDVLSLQVEVLAPAESASGEAGDGAKELEDTKESQAKAGEPESEADKSEADKSEADKSEANEPKLLGSRKFRMVSFAGAVRLEATAPVVAIPNAVELAGRALRARRPIYVDIHGQDGAWIHSLSPPIQGREAPRPWPTNGFEPGLIQAEGYHFVNAPGESTAVARVLLVEGDPHGPESLVPLLAKQREVLELPRVEKAFEKQLETNYLSHLESQRTALTTEDIVQAQTWLLGTLPIEVLGPPVAHATRDREEQALAHKKARWVNGLWWFLVAGGGGFLALTSVLIFWSHSKSARALAEAGGDNIEVEVRAAQRALLLRGAALVVTMALGLVLTVAVLDKLLWNA